ncbi:rhodanese-like domain-containing protein [Halorientalis marina]|jgi:rhodanese-related sulfurtransferase|uniref:rhodanese-like domain-containing protein n=1 Tax=Halorientalis marina TaxID=2931976 RepID=UPI001FF1FC81|nr:rhodanese-like domain-containing protein [Halorientalis marina]
MAAEISADDFADLLDADADVRVVDIRSPVAFDRERIPGSVNVPLPQLPTRVGDLTDADRIVTVCPHGHDSRRAADIITSYEGIDGETPVESLACGLVGWDGPVATDSERDRGSEGPAAPF